MGRPEKLTKEQQAEVAGLLHQKKPVKEVAAHFGISEFTARRYYQIHALTIEARAGQRAEEIRTAEEIAQESTPEAA